MIILDANILIRAVMGQRIKYLLEKYKTKGVRFCAPETAFAEANEYLPGLLTKQGKTEADLIEAMQYFRTIVEPVDPELCGIFEAEARARLRGRDEDDWPVLAAALGLGCPIWTEDTDFFGTGVAVWTTNRIEIHLRAEASSLESKTDDE